MSLTPGTRVGPYEVLGSLGEGGMGEVYRARDARLGREVALKILPEDVSADPERLARFEREAQVLASLNHPHIAAIYGVHDGPPDAGFRDRGARDSAAAAVRPPVSALILELVDGETLAELIARGPLPEREAVRLARQMADALEAAHEQGIVHRDLKPANIKITSAGTVKVLDFGLAKLVPQASALAPGSGSVSMSPTMTSPAMVTGATLLIGTASYMAPEQARGKAVDKRADIFAFGLVLYEMLTGKRAFVGESLTEVVGAVIHKDPDWSALPPATSSAVHMIVSRCLQKDPRQRFRDMGDVRLALDGAFDNAARAEAIAPRPRRTAWTAASVAAFAILAAAVAVLALRPGGEPTRPPLMRFEVPPLPNLLTVFTLSPDGRHLGMLANDAEGRSSLWVHSFESGQTRELERVGNIGGMPFWSPDGRFLGYGRPDGVYRIDIVGGPPERIGGSKQRLTHGAWSPSGVLVLGGPQSGLMQLPAGGGEAVPLTALDDSRQEFLHAGPSFLRDGRRFLYMRFSKDPGRSGVYVGSLDAPPDAQPGERVMAGAERLVTYAGSADGRQGHVLFMRDRTLMAQPFDEDALQITGEPMVVAENVGIEGPNGGPGLFSASTNGVLAFKHSEEFLRGGTPVWVDQDGTELGVAVPSAPSDTVYPQISPDGTRVALVVDNNVWVHYLDGRPPIKLTFQGGAYSPVWSPDGRRLAFELAGRVHVLPSDGSGSASEPLASGGHVHPNSWTKDGSVVVSFQSGSQELESRYTGWDVGKVSASGGDSIEPIVQTPVNEGLTGAALSPDGQWLAYVSNATGTDEMWVRPYSGSGAPVRVSADGGAMPIWARNGRELYFIAPAPKAEWRVMAARLEAGPALRFSSPRQLFETSYALGGQPPSYDVAADGRFLMLKRDSSRPPEPTHVVLNWQALVEPRD